MELFLWAIVFILLLFLLCETFRENFSSDIDFNQKIKNYCKEYKKYNFSKYADKKGVKDVVSQLGYHSPKDVDPFKENSFVCKPNNGFGKLLIVDNGKVIQVIDCGDIIKIGDSVELVRERYDSLVQKWSTQKHENSLEPWYNDIPFSMVCEEYLKNVDGTISPDYKFHVFGGRVKLAQIHYNRGKPNHKVLHTDRDYNYMNVSVVREKLMTMDEMPPKVGGWDDLVRMAEDLGSQFPYVRIDLYYHKDTPLLGEFTFSPNAGNTIIKPEKFAKEMSNYWVL